MDNGPLLALPPERVTGLPKATPLVLNCTVPVGVPPEPVTVAENVTPLCPYTDGSDDEAIAVALFT
jgi:hypothetical protein